MAPLTVTQHKKLQQQQQSVSRKRYHQVDRYVSDDTATTNDSATAAASMLPLHRALDDAAYVPMKRSRVTATSALNDAMESEAFGEFAEQFRENMVCTQCNLPLILVDHESHVSCPLCGETVEHFDATSSVMAYGDGVEFPTFNYKRSVHLDERLGQMQGRERKIVPDEDLEKIMRECKRRGYTSNDITRVRLYEVLKAISKCQYYKHITQLLTRLTGKAPPRMSPEQEEICRRMFMAAQAPFEKHKPANRRNFLSYAYTMYKICELCGFDEFLPHFALLKGPRKVAEQDEMWQKICEELDWQFISSTAHPAGFHASRQLDLESMMKRRDKLFSAATSTQK
jgi:rubrerythrin